MGSNFKTDTLLERAFAQRSASLQILEAEVAESLLKIKCKILCVLKRLHSIWENMIVFIFSCIYQFLILFV